LVCFHPFWYSVHTRTNLAALFGAGNKKAEINREKSTRRTIFLQMEFLDHTKVTVGVAQRLLQQTNLAKQIKKKSGGPLWLTERLMRK
jgi:hypothetical protein